MREYWRLQSFCKHYLEQIQPRLLVSTGKSSRLGVTLEVKYYFILLEQLFREKSKSKKLNSWEKFEVVWRQNQSKPTIYYSIAIMPLIQVPLRFRLRVYRGKTIKSRTKKESEVFWLLVLIQPTLKEYYMRNCFKSKNKGNCNAIIMRLASSVSSLNIILAFDHTYN